MGAIHIENVSKRYELHPRRDLLSRSAMRKLGGKPEPFWALRDINAYIPAGESVAIVGGNGAGKSTLLGIIAGVIAPSSGSVTRTGRISALLELGTGFHPDLTGRENIVLNASLLGLTRAEVNAKFDSIVAFSEMERFLDEPLRTYSSGMMARLAFATAIHVDPEIVVLDEVMAVGDAAFQTKCVHRVKQMADSGATMLVVSHQITLVETMCSRALWLDKGRLRLDATVGEVAAAYEPPDPTAALEAPVEGFATPHPAG
jgi:ABC-type polysaccharide/polyol phosphate transport system ATPase subunit